MCLACSIKHSFLLHLTSELNKLKNMKYIDVKKGINTCTCYSQKYVRNNIVFFGLVDKNEVLCVSIIHFSPVIFLVQISKNPFYYVHVPPIYPFVQFRSMGSSSRKKRMNFFMKLNRDNLYNK